jgi:solute carrier family 25 phosphate transporter 3|tara:strand:- start:286 stop:1362 length:1077 start_codon:yes stop_codon:yes gene_type:complete
MVMFSPSSLSHLSRFSAFSQKHVADKAAAPAPSAKPVPFAASPAEDGKVMGQGPFNLSYYLSGALAGGICCGLTHGALTPVDVVKTRIQLDPAKYNRGLIGGFSQVMEAEGAGALLTGLMPTCQGYFIQGWFKFGGVEFFKINITKSIGDEAAWNSKTKIYLAASAMAEFIADCFLCPYEACRIRLVSDPTYADGMASCAKKMVAENGFVGAFYSGFVPILFKQIPYTMAKFAVQGAAAETIYGAIGSSSDKMSKGGNITVSLGSGVVAGVVAAIISHPADTLLSKINKAGAGGSGSMLSRLGNIAAETGIVKLCTQGLAARCVMIGTLTAGQFGIFDIVMGFVGAKKFHFHDPKKAH